ncbi:MAG: hypothetical protein ACRD9R_10555 [Pyrinomonadaceae bacterium]
MKLKLLKLSFLLSLVCGGGSPARAQAPPADDLRVTPSPLKLIASGIRFAGVQESPGTDITGFIYKGRVYTDSNVPPDGFVVKDLSTDVETVYQPLELAKAAGWLNKRKRYESGNNIWGIQRSGDTIWMGTSGFGIFAFDTETGLWARHDTQVKPSPGKGMATVFYADDDYVFVGGFHIFSVKRRQWVNVLAVPRRDVVALGTNQPAPRSLNVASMRLDCRGFAHESRLIIQPTFRHGYCDLSVPGRVTLSGERTAYVFEYFHSHEDNGAPKTIFTIAKKHLEEAFTKLPRM